MKNIHIILVEPVYAGNVASIARIMNNFEFTNLRIVGKMPEDGPYYMAVHSEEILEKAQFFPDLQSAISDLDRVIAFSRRKGKQKKADMIPSKTAEFIHTSSELSYGLVFGRETFGLTDEESLLCPLRCYISANPSFPSLNLAQAVTVILYEVYAYEQKNTETDLASNEEMEATEKYILDVLKSIDFFRPREIISWEFFISNLLHRANITAEMSYRLKQLFNRIHLIIKGEGKGF
jgi:TrmH family RNA methyltransferase